MATVNDLDRALPYPHYSDRRWNKAQVIFGAQQKTEEGAYDDRLRQWDYAAHKRASETTQSPDNTARWHQEYLSAYHGKAVNLKYIMAGVNLSDGYPYYYYGYDFASE